MWDLEAGWEMTEILFSPLPFTFRCPLVPPKLDSFSYLLPSIIFPFFSNNRYKIKSLTCLVMLSTPGIKANTIRKIKQYASINYLKLSLNPFWETMPFVNVSHPYCLSDESLTPAPRIILSSTRAWHRPVIIRCSEMKGQWDANHNI